MPDAHLPKGGHAGRRKNHSGSISKADAQERFLAARANGMTVDAAAKAAQRTEKAVEYWRKTDPEFRRRADEVTAARAEAQATENPTDIDFPTFCQRYLGMRLFWHQLQWADLLEKRVPRDLHPAQTFKKGDPSRVVVNTPPFHAKSMTISIAWVTYRICMDPNIRIIIVSQTEKMAKKFLGAVKNRLTHPRWALLQSTFGPDGGWEATAESWTTTEIYIGGEKRDSGEKDPTVQALGIGGQIYGARADVVILDDTVTGKNAHQWEDQLDWLNTEVDSRIEEDTGIMVVVGTRIAPEDLYVKLRDPDDFSEAEDDAVHDGEADERPWTYLSQPAVLEFANRSRDWKTLWPKSDIPWSAAQTADADGLYDRWDGTRLARKRAKGARIWALVYQQQDVAESSTFAAHAVQACVNARRNMGPLDGRLPGHRREGMSGLHVIGGLDPAGAGYTAMVVLGVDRQTGMRYVLYAVNQARMAPHEMRAKMVHLTDLLGVAEWVIEKNAYQSSIARDEALLEPMRERGVRIREHFTGAAKFDADFGVAAMAPLFGEYDENRRLILDPKIELASTQSAHAMKSLVEQLITWQPNAPKTQKTDLVMALWFAELRARVLLAANRGNRRTHMPSRFVSPRRAARQGVVNLLDYAQQRGA